MAFIDTTAASIASGDTYAMYERQQRSYGYVPNYAKVFCHRPEIMSLWAALQRGIKGHMDKRAFELATVAAAMTLRSSYCSLAHATQLREFFSDREIEWIVTGEGVARGVINKAEEAMMAFASRIARDASAVTKDDIDILKGHGFSDGEIFDFAATAAARSFFTKIVDGLGSLGDHDYEHLDPALRERLVVGRRICVGETERVQKAVDTAGADIVISHTKA